MEHSVLSAYSVIHLKDSRSQSRRRCPFVKVSLLLGLVWFALLPTARAVIPAPDGGYPDENTAEGTDALFNLNTDLGFGNTAIGFEALFSDTTGFENTATGAFALKFNTTGTGNTATGYFALLVNATGTGNTATGLATLSSNKGDGNTATGGDALEFNTSGSNNTANGVFALGNNTTGSSNIGLGASAGASLNTGSNNIYIGSPGGSAGESNRIRIGTIGMQKNAFIAGVFGVTVATGVPVIVDSNGRLGTTTSSERFKDAIKPMDKASEAILALKPVTFHYKQELDPDGTAQFGLVAEEVEKVDPDLVVRDEQGKPYTVRYEAVNAMLLNEFLKEHRKVEQQAQINQQQAATIAQQRKDFERTMAQQQKEIQALSASLKEQAARIEKASDQVAVSKATPHLVVNDR